jgi:hypothetical protein
MTNQEQPNNPQGSNEIDLGQLFELIKKGFDKLFKMFLRIFVYFKKNIIKLGVLIAIGVGVGFLMNKLIPKKLKVEVLVKPNFESEDYLYATVDEIASNIIAKDTVFFRNMEIDVSDLQSFMLQIEPLEEVEVDKDIIEQGNKYLEVLQNYRNDEFILNVIKSEILQKSIQIHRITFSYKDATSGEEITRKLINYLNANPYFKELQQVSIQNAKTRIENNKKLVAQIDELVSGYARNMANEQVGKTETQGVVLVEGDNGLNITNLLNLKDKLEKEIEGKNIQILEQNNAISIQNFGKTQAVQKSLLGKYLFLFPSILLGAFFVLSFLLYLNKKSKELL